MLIGVDVLWVRPGINGGTESVIRNLLKSFGEMGKESFLLFVSLDNRDSFAQYAVYDNIRLCPCEVASASPLKRVLWQNLHLDRLARREGIDVMFSPIYSIPRKSGAIPYVAVIHDMQALHYPEYFGKARNLFFRRAWRNTCRYADAVITISDYCKDEIRRFCPEAGDRIIRIYNPVDVKPVRVEPADGKETDREKQVEEARHEQNVRLQQVTGRYGVEAGAYDYCVSSLLPHKNLETLLRMKALPTDDGTPLLISGVGGRGREFQDLVQELKLEGKVIRTGFVSDEDRNVLYAGCRLFLFPSVFEGFGMPPIEALAFGKRVVMTREACLREVTRDQAVYVTDPYDPSAWAVGVQEALTLPERTVMFEDYAPHSVAEQYLQVFRKVYKPHNRAE